MATALQTGMVLWSTATKRVEKLTVPLIDVKEAYKRRKAKYSQLTTEDAQNGQNIKIFHVEVGCRGFIAICTTSLHASKPLTMTSIVLMALCGFQWNAKEWWYWWCAYLCSCHHTNNIIKNIDLPWDLKCQILLVLLFNCFAKKRKNNCANRAQKFNIEWISLSLYLPC